MGPKEIPTFDGKEAYWWIINITQYFEAQGVSKEEEKNRLAVGALRGEAFQWWCGWRWHQHKVTWWIFVKSVLKRFQPEMDPDLPIYVEDDGESQDSRKDDQELVLELVGHEKEKNDGEKDIKNQNLEAIFKRMEALLQEVVCRFGGEQFQEEGKELTVKKEETEKEMKEESFETQILELETTQKEETQPKQPIFRLNQESRTQEEKSELQSLGQENEKKVGKEPAAVEKGHREDPKTDMGIGEERWKKLEIHLFLGEDAYGCTIVRINNYWKTAVVASHQQWDPGGCFF